MKATPAVWFGILMATALGVPGDSPRAEAAAPQAPTAAPSEDEKAIRAMTAAFDEAFDKGDAKAIAAMFTEQGEAIDLEGTAIRGRADLEAHYAERFGASPGDKIEPTIELVHFLGKTVARQDGRSKIVPADGSQPYSAKFTATFVKDEGKWLIASIRELEDSTIGHHERLQELEWMIGNWVEETGDAVISSSIAWSEDGNFLLRSYDIKVEGKPELKGTQRIGWDPLTKQIKSWVFDSRGGYSDGFWTRGGEQWIIKSAGVRPDGLTTSATQVLTRVSKDRLLWKSTDRTIGGETRDDLQEFMMVRKPPEPK